MPIVLDRYRHYTSDELRRLPHDLEAMAELGTRMISEALYTEADLELEVDKAREQTRIEVLQEVRDMITDRLENGSPDGN